MEAVLDMASTVVPHMEQFDNMTFNMSEVPYLPHGLYFHPHWHAYRQYLENIPDIIFYALGLYMAVVGFIGITGNFLVLYFFST